MWAGVALSPQGLAGVAGSHQHVIQGGTGLALWVLTQWPKVGQGQLRIRY